MVKQRLQKYLDFKGYVDEYLQGIIDKDEILEILEILRRRYDRQHSALLDPLEHNPKFYEENKSWIDPLREAAIKFEEARDTIEDAILHDDDDPISEALEVFKEGNRLLIETSMDIDDMLEHVPFLDIL